MSSTQRAFVGRKNRSNAHLVRMQVQAGGLVHPLPMAKIDADSRTDTQIILADVVDPMDVEEVLSQRKKSTMLDLSSVSSPRNLHDFPVDDLDVRMVVREWPTVSPPVEISSIPSDSPARDIVHSLIDQFSLIQRKYEHYCTGETMSRILRERPTITSNHVYENDKRRRITRSSSILEPDTGQSKRSSYTSCVSNGTTASQDVGDGRLHSSMPDQVLPGILERVSISQMEESNEQKRQNSRYPSIVGLLFPKNEEDIMELRGVESFPEERSGPRLLIRITKLSSEVIIEPMFLSLTLFDVKQKKRVSESFYWDTRLKKEEDEAAEKCCQAAFATSSPLSDLFLVVKLEKFLQGCDPSDVFDMYMAGREDRKRIASGTGSSSRLNSYRMLMSIMFVDLNRLLMGTNSLEKMDSMGNSVATAHSEEAPVANEETSSIVSVDRVSVCTNSTFKRVGSGSSASTVLNRVRTPLQKRKMLVSAAEEEESHRPPLTLSSIQPTSITLNNWTKVEPDKISDEEIVKTIAEIRRTNPKHKKGFPVDLGLRIWGENCDELECRLNASGDKLSPFVQTVDVTQEVAALPAPGRYAVNMSYKNIMYIYPKSVNMTGKSGTARNISIKVQLMNQKEMPLTVFFDRRTRTPSRDHALTTVLYHNKFPSMGDEIKLSIPVDLSDGHHLLFTFYHISCKPVDKDEPIEFPLGYAWLPLLRENSLSHGNFNLPIALEKLPQSYGYLWPDVVLPNIKWLDGHKPVFSLSLVAISSIHPQDEHIERFFSSFSSLSSSPANESSLISTINGITKAAPEPMVAFLYNILDKLIALIANSPYSREVSSACFTSLAQLAKICTMLLDENCDMHGRGSLLSTYIHFYKISMKESRSRSSLCNSSIAGGSNENEGIFNIIEGIERSRTVPPPVHNNKNIHEELLDLWVRSRESDTILLNSWFFFELIFKSMAEYLSMTGRLFLPRKNRFSDRFSSLLSQLSQTLSSEVISKCSMDGRLASSISNSFAFFLRDCLSLVDRTFVLSLVASFCRTLIEKINTSDPLSTQLVLLKISFVRIVCSHEHLIILNMPFNVVPPVTSSSSSSIQPPSPSSSSISSGSSLRSELTQEYRSRHFLLALILSDLNSILETCSNNLIRTKCISVLACLLASHEVDPRLSDSSSMSRVASLYLPLLSILIDSVPLIFDPSEHRANTNRSSDGIQCVKQVHPEVALVIAGMSDSASLTSDSVGGSSPVQSVRPSLTLEQSRLLLSCLCWVVRHLERVRLSVWLSDLSPSSFVALLDLLQMTVSCMEYRPLDVDEEDGETLRKSSQVKWRITHNSQDSNVEVEGLLSAEATVCVLDVTETMMRVVSSPGNEHLLFSLPILFRLIMHMLSCNQSVSVLEKVFATQRLFVAKYADLVFEQETEQCGELCLQLLRLCASRLPAVRSQAVASVYLLMRESYESCSCLARVKMHFTMSLSTLVSNGTRSGSWLNEDYLRRSLKTLLIYTQSESTSTSLTTLHSFCEQVKDLVFNMHMILSDTVRMKEFANDFEMSMDLIYRIAKGYQNNPDLRVTWLLTMSVRAADRSLFAEAAQCTLHASALVAEYLAMLPPNHLLPKGAVAFSAVSANILEESAVSDDVISPDTEGICESRHFSEEGLVHLVEKTFHYMEKASMYEYMPVLFKVGHALIQDRQVVEPMIREWRDFKRLASLHNRLGDALGKIEPIIGMKEEMADAWISPLRSADKRCFGTYFRVGFYGIRFGDMDGEEFVYKEPPFTKLSEISSRLESFYSDRFGKGMVEVIKDSNTVVRETLDPTRAYLQITYVEPYLEKWERRRRSTHFERSVNLKRFVYATPFTRDGRAHGHLKDQYKRRTILTTQHNFPYVKSRIRVVEREQRVLSPIEVAIEDVTKKTRELAAAMAQTPLDAKMLQMVLQGCIGTTVNQGPIEVANVFLQPLFFDEAGRPVDRMQNKLRMCFRDFSNKCGDALTLNKQLIQNDQLAYQNELQKNYADFTKKLSAILEQSCIGNIHRGPISVV